MKSERSPFSANRRRMAILMYKTEAKHYEELEKSLCSCMTDPFSNLPPELRPRTKDILSGLRKLKCPACGFEYWTKAVIPICVLIARKKEYISRDDRTR